jgi:hypothetical protein
VVFRDNVNDELRHGYKNESAFLQLMHIYTLALRERDENQSTLIGSKREVSSVSAFDAAACATFAINIMEMHFS